MCLSSHLPSLGNLKFQNKLSSSLASLDQQIADKVFARKGEKRFNYKSLGTHLQGAFQPFRIFHKMFSRFLASR